MLVMSENPIKEGNRTKYDWEQTRTKQIVEYYYKQGKCFKKQDGLF